MPERYALGAEKIAESHVRKAYFGDRGWLDTPVMPRCSLGKHSIAGPGIIGTLGTIKRADGATQATYNGHPLYTYAGDTQPGQAKGNGIKGVWHEVTPGTAAAASSPGTGGNGY